MQLAKAKKSGQVVDSPEVRRLRLMFLTSDDGRGEYLDFDLGKTADDRDKMLNPVKAELVQIWKHLTQLIDQNDPKLFWSCDRSFCFCHPARKLFTKASVAQNQKMDEKLDGIAEN